MNWSRHSDLGFLHILVGFSYGVFVLGTTSLIETSTTPNLAPTTLSWLDGYERCLTTGSNFSLPSPNNTDNLTSFPAWTFGLVVTRNYGDGQRNFTVSSLPTSLQARSCCVENVSVCHGIETYETNYSIAEEFCMKRNQTMFHIKGDNALSNYKSGNAILKSYWAGSVNVTSLFKGDNISVLCVLADRTGRLMVDNCDQEHWVVCVQENSKPIFYLPQLNESDRFPAYMPTSSSGITRVTTYPTDSSFMPTAGTGDRFLTMEPHIVYVVAGVGAVVMLSVCILALCCCCRRCNKKTDRTVVFEAYSEAPDSIVFKEKEKDDQTIYATPDDAIKAKRRSSIAEDEYDVLRTGGDSSKSDHHNTGNVYSHMVMGRKKSKNVHTETHDDTYDVTNNRTSISVSAITNIENNTYEHIQNPKSKR